MSTLESDEIVQKWLEGHDHRSFGHFINNKWYKPDGRKTYEPKNPCTGKVLASTIQGTEDDVNMAVAAANEALKTWSKLPGYERRRHMYNLARCVEKHAKLFALLESMDNGKCVGETQGFDVPTFIRHLEYNGGWAELMDDEFKGRWKEVGVIGAIVPWNFPLLLMGWKICPALAMGNTVVLKPATYTRLSALLFADICAEAGLPPGVFNVVTGNGAMGSILASHPDIDKVGFTGSTEIGKELRKVTAGSGKKLSLELGGKSPMIVHADCDLDQVVNGVVVAIYFNQGQVCCAGSRLIVQDTIYDKLVEKIKQRLATFRVGDCLDKNVQMGALVDLSQWNTVEEYVRSARQDGSTVFQSWDSLPPSARATPEEIASGKLTPKGCGLFYPPTIITNCKLDAKVVVEEIFGPVVTVLPFKTPKEALDIANDTCYGLGGSVWTKNVSLGLETCLGIKAGAIWFNCYNAFDAAAGFGGYKQSGYGRDGGKEGLFEYIKPSWMKNFRGHAKSFTLDIAKFGASEKDVKKEVDAAVKTARAAAAVWGKRAAFNRSKILYHLAETLEKRRAEFGSMLSKMTGQTENKSLQEVDLSIRRLFYWAAYADKYGGEIQETLTYGCVLKIQEPMGVVGISCPDESPLLGFISLLAPALTRANTVVISPSQRFPAAAVEIGKIIASSDNTLIPSGVVSILTGERDPIAKHISEHPDIDSAWYFGSAEGSKYVEMVSAGNLKRTFVGYGRPRAWESVEEGQGLEYLYHATQAKLVWIPITETMYK